MQQLIFFRVHSNECQRPKAHLRAGLAQQFLFFLWRLKNYLATIKLYNYIEFQMPQRNETHQ